MGSHEIVDLALSDDDEGGNSNKNNCLAPQENQQIDLTDECVEIPPPRAPLSPRTAATPHNQAGSLDVADNVTIVNSALKSEDVLASNGCLASSTSTPGTAVPVEAGSTGSSGTASSHGGSGARECASCTNQDVPLRHTFSLERCRHRLCPACMVANVSGVRCSSSPADPVCPLIGCAMPVSVRDLALVLDEQAWCALQARKLAAFRGRAQQGVRCPGCAAWVEACSTEENVVVGGDRRGGGRSGACRGAGGKAAAAGGNSSEGGGGTARQRADRLLSTPLLVCKTCRTRACQFCGARANKQSPPCACGGATLWSASGLLALLEELVENPADVTLTGPVGPLKKSSAARKPAATGNGRGRGSSSGGRGAYTFSGRGRGRGKGGWGAYLGPGGLLEYGDAWGAWGAGNNGISSKWSKGTGYGGSGDSAAAAAAQAVAAEAESRADRAMGVVFDALASRLPSRGEYPEHVPELVALVRESSLLQVVCAYLRNDSLMDIAKRLELYQVGDARAVRALASQGSC